MFKTDISLSAVVVLYNPTIEVIKNIRLLNKYVDEIYTIDNSENKNSKIVDEINKLPKVKYVKNKGNYGIASALNLGASMALSNGYRLLLTMDQDSQVEEDMIDNMMFYIKSGLEFGIISPVYRLIPGDSPPSIELITEVETTMTSGNILNLDAFRVVGPFLEKLFIDYVDHEYCLRMRKYGYKIFRIENAVLHHSWGKLKKINLLIFTFYKSNYSPLRYYYLLRNGLYVTLLYKHDYPQFCRKERKLILKMIMKSLIFEGSRIEKIKFLFRGYRDYINDNYYQYKEITY